MEIRGKVTDQLLSAVESLLYAADDPVSAERLVEVLETADGPVELGLDADANLVRSACLELEERYRVRGSALQVLEIAGGYRLGTRPRFDHWIRALREAEQPTRLSIPLLETLAVIAYRQPASNAEITAIRGKDPSSAIRRLRDLGLVRISGRRRTVGRPFTYGTTERFLELFGLRELEELPRARGIPGASGVLALRFMNTVTSVGAAWWQSACRS